MHELWQIGTDLFEEARQALNLQVAHGTSQAHSQATAVRMAVTLQWNRMEPVTLEMPCIQQDQQHTCRCRHRAIQHMHPEWNAQVHGSYSIHEQAQGLTEKVISAIPDCISHTYALSQLGSQYQAL